MLGYAYVSRVVVERVGVDEQHRLIWLTIRYGERMRAYVDVGYPDFYARAPLNDVRE